MINSSIVVYFSMMSFHVSMTCFFLVYRFHIEAVYYLVLIVDRLVLQFKYRQWACYQGERKGEEYFKMFYSYIDARNVDAIISGAALLVMILEIVYQMYRRRYACFK